MKFMKLLHPSSAQSTKADITSSLPAYGSAARRPAMEHCRGLFPTSDTLDKEDLVAVETQSCLQSP
jgi:hypothetical protein